MKKRNHDQKQHPLRPRQSLETVSGGRKQDPSTDLKANPEGTPLPA